MDDLMAARTTMGMSLGFHIIFASFGMILPVLMAVAHGWWLKTENEAAYRLTRAWARGTAILFAVGAVSGTALSFELGLLWPRFMAHAGPIIGMPFSLEGAAFFIEAIALGVFLYGWGRVSARVHWATGVVVGLAGLASGGLVIAANGWMNSPTGFDWNNGNPINIDPIAAMLNPAWFWQAIHMLVGAAEAVGFAVAGVHALRILRGDKDPIHRLGLTIALVVGAVAALTQPLVGHASAQDVARRQPVKLAAIEALFETTKGADLSIGGWPDMETGEVHWAIEVPGGLSFLAFNDFDAEVQGLDQTPRSHWPPVPVVHIAFQIMVGIGSFLAGLALLSLWMVKTQRYPSWFLRLLVLSIPLGFIAIEAGWIVTEVGRQPWIIYGLLKTADGLTPVKGQVYHLALFALLYAGLGISTVWMWWRQVRQANEIPGPDDALRQWAKKG